MSGQSAAAQLVQPRGRRGWADHRRDLRDQGGPASDPRRCRDRRDRRSRCRRRGGRPAHHRLLYPHHRLPHRRRRHGGGRALPVRASRRIPGDGQGGQAADRRLVGHVVAEDAAAGDRLVQLSAHGRLRRYQGRGSDQGRIRRTAPHPRADGLSSSRQDARLRKQLCRRRRAADRRAPDPSARRRVRRHQRGHRRARPLRRQHRAWTRLLHALPGDAAGRCRSAHRRRPPLFGDDGGAEDLARWAISDPAGLDNPVFCSLNRNKRSIALDLRGEEGKTVIRDLVRDADVVVSNFRAGVMERMGFGYADLRALNKRIIYAFGSGFGPVAPNAHKGGQDVLAHALTGVMMRHSDAAHPLAIYPTALADYSAGMHLVQGILLALLQRQRSGEGQAINVSLYNSMLAMQMQEAAMWLMRERELNWGAMPLSGAFATSDGALVMVGAFKTNPLQEICIALGIDDLSADPRYATPEKQAAERPVLQAIFRERFATNTTDYWIARLERQDLLCAPVRSLAEALDDPQTEVNAMIVETKGDSETVRLVGSPLDMSASPFAIRRPPPPLGAHGAAILAEFGYDAGRIAELKATKVLG